MAHAEKCPVCRGRGEMSSRKQGRIRELCALLGETDDEAERAEIVSVLLECLFGDRCNAGAAFLCALNEEELGL